MGLFSSFHSDKFSTHEGQCGSCCYLDVDYGSLKWYCSKRGRFYQLSESKCSYYIKDNSRNRDFWMKIYTYYILTAVFDILGLDKENQLYQETMTLIQLIREDDSTVKEAVGYDILGKDIADKLRQDPNREEIAKYLLTNYLTRVYIAIETNNQEDAINIYKEMVVYLVDKYQKQDSYNNLIDGTMLESEQVKILIK